MFGRVALGVSGKVFLRSWWHNLCGLEGPHVVTPAQRYFAQSPVSEKTQSSPWEMP